MPKYDGYKLDYSKIPDMKNDALEKAKRYFSALKPENTGNFLVAETTGADSTEKANIRDKNALKAHLLDLYNLNKANQEYAEKYGRLAQIKKSLKKINAKLESQDVPGNNNVKDANTLTEKEIKALEKTRKELEQEQKTIISYPEIHKSLVGVLEYLNHGRPSDVSSSLTDIDRDKPVLGPIEDDIIYLMQHSSAARYHLVLFKEQLDPALQNQIMVCELRRRIEAYRSKTTSEKHHKKYAYLVSLTTELSRVTEAAAKNNTTQEAFNYPQADWDILMGGTFSHKTRDLLNFFKIKTMVALESVRTNTNEADDMDEMPANNNRFETTSQASESSRTSSIHQIPQSSTVITTTDPQNNQKYDDVSDNASVISDTSEHSFIALRGNQSPMINEMTNDAANSSANSLPTDIVKKYDRLSALAFGYRALSLLSPLSLSNTNSVLSFLSSQVYRATLAPNSEEEKAKKKALKFCVDMIERTVPNPLMPVTSILDELTEKQQIELYRFFECFHKNAALQPYSIVTTLLDLPENQNHDFWQHYGHELTLETPAEYNKRKNINKDISNKLEPRVVYLRYKPEIDQKPAQMKYSVISSTGKGEVIDDRELRGVNQRAIDIYSGKYVQFVSEKPTENIEAGILYIYLNKTVENDLQCLYQSNDSTSLKDDANCLFLNDKIRSKVLKQYENTSTYSHNETFKLKNAIIEAARLPEHARYGLQNVGYNKEERKAAEDHIYSLLSSQKHVHPYRFTKFKEVFKAREDRQDRLNNSMRHYSATK